MSQPALTPQHPDVPRIWTTCSKKEMLLGLSVLGAGIGIEPICFFTGGAPLLLFPLVVIGAGLFLVVLGFLHEDELD